MKERPIFRCPEHPNSKLCYAMRILSLNPNTVVVEVGAKLDFTGAERFKRLLRERIDGGTRHVVLDFSDTTVLDSRGLGAIFSLYRALSPLGGTIAFANVSRAVRLVARLTRIDRVFPQFNSVQAAAETRA